MWAAEIRWQTALHGLSQDQVGNEQAKILWRPCCGHSWWEPPWCRKLVSDGKFVFGISALNQWYRCYWWQKLNSLLWCRILMIPYTKRYGEDTFIYQSVWSNNEYDVSLGNKPRDVMGIGALAENIISAKFPDDNDKLFDANEFIDLNQGPHPEIGLNFQARES